jgi:hypothetical protein
MERYLCWFAHEKPYIPHDTMVEMMVGSTSNSSNVYEVVYNNSSSYINMIMDVMRMNQGYADQYPIIDKEPNANAIRFFDLLKYLDEPWVSNSR